MYSAPLRQHVVADSHVCARRSDSHGRSAARRLGTHDCPRPWHRRGAGAPPMVKSTHWSALSLLRWLASAVRRGGWPRLKRPSINPWSIALLWRRGRAENLPPLLQVVMASWASQSVYVAAKLGVADALRDGPKSCDEIAIATGAPAGRSLVSCVRSAAWASSADPDRTASCSG